MNKKTIITISIVVLLYLVLGLLTWYSWHDKEIVIVDSELEIAGIKT